MRTEFLVAKYLSVLSIQGTSFIDVKVDDIFPRERCIVLKDMSEVSIGQKFSAISAIKLAKDYYVPISTEFVVPDTSKQTGPSWGTRLSSIGSLGQYKPGSRHEHCKCPMIPPTLQGFRVVDRVTSGEVSHQGFDSRVCSDFVQGKQ
jgi:hypothetical protein